jgi:hypothetical protein
MKVIAIIYKDDDHMPQASIEMNLDCVPRKGDAIYFNDDYEIEGDLFVHKVEWCLDESTVPHVNLIIKPIKE